MSEEKYGRIVQIIGPVIDVAFDDEAYLPNLLDALEIEKDNGDKIITEVQQDMGENTMRTIAMDSTDGLRRGMKVRCLGSPISMPTGEQVKGLSCQRQLHQRDLSYHLWHKALSSR